MTIQEAHPDVFGPPAGTVGAGFDEGPNPPKHERVGAATSIMQADIEAVGRSVAKFDRIAAGLAELEKAHPKDIACDLTISAGRQQAVAGRAAWRAPRLEVEKIRQAAKAPVLDLGRAIDSFAKTIEQQLRLGEDHYDEQIKTEEKRLAAEKESKRVAEEQRVAMHQNRIDHIRQCAIAAVGEEVDHIDASIIALAALKIGKECEEFEAATLNAHHETMDKLRSLRTAQAQRDAEAAELARLREADDARKAQEAAALAESRRQEAEKLKAEALALAETRKAQMAEFAARDAELRRQEAEAAALHAKLVADGEAAARAARVIREAEEAQVLVRQAELRRKEDAEAAERERVDRVAKEAAEQARLIRAAQDETQRAAAGQMLEALRAVQDWDMEANALPDGLAKQIELAIGAASIPPTEPTKSQMKRVTAQKSKL